MAANPGHTALIRNTRVGLQGILSSHIVTILYRHHAGSRWPDPLKVVEVPTELLHLVLDILGAWCRLGQELDHQGDGAHALSTVHQPPCP